MVKKLGMTARNWGKHQLGVSKNLLQIDCESKGIERKPIEGVWEQLPSMKALERCKTGKNRSIMRIFGAGLWHYCYQEQLVLVVSNELGGV